MVKICIICAIDQEISPIVKRFPAKGIPRLCGFPAWSFQAFGNSVTLIRSGIGIRKAAGAALAAADLQPAAIVSAGFCGSLSPGVAVGEVFLAETLYRYSSGSLSCALTAGSNFTGSIGSGLRKGTFITSDEIIGKDRLYPLLPDPSAMNMLDMESFAVAETCYAHGIDFAAIRSVSDTADQDPSRLFRQVSDYDHNIRMAQVALSLIKKPSILPELLLLSKNAAIAGRSLAKAVEQTLERI